MYYAPGDVISDHRVQKSINHSLLSGEQEADEELEELMLAIDKGKIKIVAHNAAFERDVLKSCLNQLLAANMCVQFATPKNYDNMFLCTSNLARVVQAPAKLELAAKALKTPVKKDTDGGKLMKATMTAVVEDPGEEEGQTLGKTYEWRKVAGAYRKCSDEIEKAVSDYCDIDVIATAHLLPRLQNKLVNDSGEFLPHIKAGYAMNEAINAAGIAVDTDRLKQISQIHEEVLKEANKFCMEKFGVDKITKKVKLIKAFQEAGYRTKSVGKPAIKEMLVQEYYTDEQKRTLKRFSELNSSSMAKANTGLAMQSDGRLYNGFIFSGASKTGRWSSKAFQLQNLPRPSKSYEDTNKFFENYKQQSYTEDLEKFGLSGIRTCIKAKKGHKLFIADLRQIEPRMTLWETGELKELKDMHEGADLYIETASQVYGVDKEDVDAEQRNVGKHTRLSLNYQSGRDKFRSMVLTMSGILLDDATIDRCFRYHYDFCSYVHAQWKKYDKMLRQHLSSGKPLKVKLASGRYLNYGRIKWRSPIETCKETGKKKKLKARMMYWDGIKWNNIYGGKLFNNVIQGQSRDVLLLKMNAMHGNGHTIVGSVHDEAILEVPEDTCEEKLKKEWAEAGADYIEKFFPGLLLDSDTQFRDRYFK